MLPPYACSVSYEGPLAVRYELVTPFKLSTDRQWYDVYVVLRGTQLRLYELKTSRLHKSRKPCVGALIESYTLQHAELGVAADFRKTALVPRNPFAKLIPTSLRQKAFESDPHLFEPVREHCLRLRLETKQMLFCAETVESLLAWFDKICAAVDISSPLDDMSEPRTRTLPRRVRRRERPVELGNVDALGVQAVSRRLVAEQERIIRTMYPHLASLGMGHTTGSNTEGDQVPPNSDPEGEDLDPAGLREPPASRQDNLARAIRSSSSDRAQRRRTVNPHQALTADACIQRSPLERSISTLSRQSPTTEQDDPKPARSRRGLTPAQHLRYRRRCANVLLAADPRLRNVVWADGRRMIVDMKRGKLVPFELAAPKYSSHRFPEWPAHDSDGASAVGQDSPITEREASVQDVMDTPHSRLDGSEEEADRFCPSTSTSSLAYAPAAAADGAPLSLTSSAASSGKQQGRQQPPKQRRKSMPMRLFSTDSLANFILPKSGVVRETEVVVGLVAF